MISFPGFMCLYEFTVSDSDVFRSDHLPLFIGGGHAGAPLVRNFAQRSKPPDPSWMARVASSENTCSLTPAILRWWLIYATMSFYLRASRWLLSIIWEARGRLVWNISGETGGVVVLGSAIGRDLGRGR